MRGSAKTNGHLFDSELVQRSGIWDASELVSEGACQFCGSTDSRDVASRKDGLVIRECARCRLAFVDPRPSGSQLHDYYNNGYFNGARDFFRGKDYCRERDEAIANRAVTGYREIIAHFNVAGKTVLDIGCASGALLCLFREQQAKGVLGIDSAAYPISFGVERYGLDLRCTTLEDADLPARYFDLITLIDLIEHVEDLNTFLHHLERVAKPGGHIFLITPNYSAFAFARDKWTCLFKDFEHLQYFSEDSLNEMCKRFGWKLLKCWSDSVPFVIHEYPRLYESGMHRLLHPSLALRNRVSESRYKRAAKSDHLMGGSLNAIVQVPQ